MTKKPNKPSRADLMYKDLQRWRDRNDPDDIAHCDAEDNAKSMWWDGFYAGEAFAKKKPGENKNE